MSSDSLMSSRVFEYTEF